MTITELAAIPGMGLPNPETDRFDAWASEGNGIATAHSQNHWALGDWIAYGAANWPERYIEAAATIAVPKRIIAEATKVAMLIPPDKRRPDLSWSHHRAVCDLEPDHQQAWLQRALDEHFTADELDRHVRRHIAIEAQAVEEELPGMPPKPLWPKRDTLDALVATHGLDHRIWIDPATGDCGLL